MSVPDSIVAAQLQGLLRWLDADRERRCTAEQANARERARAIVRAARSEARRRMQEAVRYERTRLDEALALRRAELEAARRRDEHAATRDLVGRACDGLHAALSRRWQDSHARRAWCEAALVAAAQRICGSDWQIEIAPGASQEEREAFLARARALRGGEHSLNVRADLGVGLRVHAAGTVLDATVAGLLDDLPRIGAQFLHEWLHTPGRASAGAEPA